MMEEARANDYKEVGNLQESIEAVTNPEFQKHVTGIRQTMHAPKGGGRTTGAGPTATGGSEHVAGPGIATAIVAVAVIVFVLSFVVR